MTDSPPRARRPPLSPRVKRQRRLQQPRPRTSPGEVFRAQVQGFGHYGAAFDGLLECPRGRLHVSGNLDRVEGRDTPRARFTPGHDLGHFFIDEHRNALRNGLAPSHPSVCD